MKTKKKILTAAIGLLSAATIATTASVLVQNNKNNATTISTKTNNVVKNKEITKESSCKKNKSKIINGSFNDKKSLEVGQVEFSLKDITIDAFANPDDVTKPENIIAIKEITGLNNDKGFSGEWQSESSNEAKSNNFKTYIEANKEKFFNNPDKLSSIDYLRFDFSKTIDEDDDSKTFSVNMKVTTTDGEKYFYTNNKEENAPSYEKKDPIWKIKLKRFNFKKWTEAVGTKIQEVFRKAIEEDYSVEENKIKDEILEAINVDEILNFIPDINISCDPNSDVKKFDETSFAEINLNWISLANKFNDNYGKVVINNNNVITLKMENFKDSYTSFGAGWVFDTSKHLLIPKIDTSNPSTLIKVDISQDEEINKYSISEMLYLYNEYKNERIDSNDTFLGLIKNIIKNKKDFLFQGEAKDTFDFDSLQFKVDNFLKNGNDIKVKITLNEGVARNKFPYVKIGNKNLYYKDLEFELTGFKEVPGTTTLKEDNIDLTNDLDGQKQNLINAIFKNPESLSSFKSDWAKEKPALNSVEEINIDNVLQNKAHSSTIKNIEYNGGDGYSINVTFSGYDDNLTYSESITKTINFTLKEDPTEDYLKDEFKKAINSYLVDNDYIFNVEGIKNKIKESITDIPNSWKAKLDNLTIELITEESDINGLKADCQIKVNFNDKEYIVNEITLKKTIAKDIAADESIKDFVTEDIIEAFNNSQNHKELSSIKNTITEFITSSKKSEIFQELPADAELTINSITGVEDNPYAINVTVNSDKIYSPSPITSYALNSGELTFKITDFKNTSDATSLAINEIKYNDDIFKEIFKDDLASNSYIEDWDTNNLEAYKNKIVDFINDASNINKFIKNPLEGTKVTASSIKCNESKNNCIDLTISFKGKNEKNKYVNLDETITITLNTMEDDSFKKNIDSIINDVITNLVSSKEGEFITADDIESIKTGIINKLNEQKQNLPQSILDIKDVTIDFDKIDTTKNPMIVQSGAITIIGNNDVKLSNTTNLEISQENNQTTLIKDVVDANTELDIIQTMFSSANDKGFSADWKLEHEQDQLAAKINNLKQNLIQNKESYFNNIPIWFEVKNVSLKTCDFDNNKLIFNIEYNGYVQERTARGIQNAELTINLKSTTDAINNVFGEEYDKVINDIINNSPETPTSDSFKESIADYLESNKNNLPDSMIPSDGNFDKDDIKINWDKVHDNDGVISFPEGSIEIINTKQPIKVPVKEFNFTVENETNDSLKKGDVPWWVIILMVGSTALILLVLFILLSILSRRNNKESRNI